MRRPRLTIGSLMLGIVLIAADCAALHTGISGLSATAFLLLFGGLPMVHVLAGAFVPILGHHQRGTLAASRSLGFAIGGMAALVTFTFLAVYFPAPIFSHVVDAASWARPYGRAAVFGMVAATLVGPQLAVATLVGMLTQGRVLPAIDG